MPLHRTGLEPLLFTQNPPSLVASPRGRPWSLPGVHYPLRWVTMHASDQVRPDSAPGPLSAGLNAGRAVTYCGGVRNLRVLFIGGSGTISSACSWLAAERDIELFVLNRGVSMDRPLPAQATVLHGDVRDPVSDRDAVGDREFDAVV